MKEFEELLDKYVRVFTVKKKIVPDDFEFYLRDDVKELVNELLYKIDNHEII